MSFQASASPRASTAPAPRVARGELALYGAWAALAVALALVFVVLTWRVEPGRHVIQGVDGISYSLWVRSLVLDGDLDFSDEIDRVHPGEIPGGELETPTGLRPNKYGAGVALLAAPAFVLARAVDRAQGASGVEWEEGWTRVDRTAIALASIFWGWLGLVLAHRVARRVTGAFAAGVAITALWLGSNLLYYFVREPFQAHLDSVFACSLALWLTVRARESGLRTLPWALAGAAVGLATMVRFTNALLLVVPVAMLWRSALGAGGRRAPALAALALLTGAAIGFAPQALAWRQVYGSFLVYTYEAESFAHLARPRLLEVLFASRHGLLSWSPIYALALAGWPTLTRRAGAFAHALALWGLLLLLTLASWEQWWLGHSFGHRGFLGLLPVFAASLACLWERAAAPRARRMLAVALIAAALWNGLLMLAFLSEMIPYSGSFSWWDYVTSLPDLPGHIARKMGGG